MPDWASLSAIARDFFLLLGGTAFLWRIVDLYRDRVRLDLADVSFTENGPENQPELVTELDNAGKQAVLLKRQAILHGVHLGWSTPTGGWIRPKVRSVLRLTGDRRLPPVSSALFRWHPSEDQLPELGPYWLFWVRVHIRLSNRRRRLTIRVRQLGDKPIGPIRYWTGYALFRFGGKLLRWRRERKEVRRPPAPQA